MTEAEAAQLNAINPPGLKNLGMGNDRPWNATDAVECCRGGVFLFANASPTPRRG